MIRSGNRRNGFQDVEIELSPMIDCVFILLIFFIVTSVFVDDPGITVERPDVSGTEITDRNVLLIAINAEDRVFFDGQEVRLEHIASLLNQARFNDDIPLIIRADRNASHGMFASVHAEAERAGIDRIQFSTNESR